MNKDFQWIEVWIDYGSDGGGFLVLRLNKENQYELVNPHNNNELFRIFSEYSAATQWLAQEEFELIEGRWFPDKGSPE